MGNSGAKNRGVEDGRKFVCILYSGQNQTHKKNTRAFRDALQADPAGRNLKMLSPVDVSSQGFHAEDHLRAKPQNLILLSVDEEGAAVLQNAIDDAKPRVLSISFGTKRPQDMIQLLNNRQRDTDQKDFCFNFRNISDLDANDFSNSPVLQQLITSLMAAQ